MRMRRKKHLEERMTACEALVTSMYGEERSFDPSIRQERFLDLKSVFKREAPLYLEIGCGKGQFACELAKRNPDINILAVEKSSNVLVDAAERAMGEDLPNLHFLLGPAEYLPSYLAPKCADRIYLNFSCPFPKKSYASHRLTHRGFLEIYKKLLKDGAEIHQKTDNVRFFEFSIEEFSQSGFMLKNVTFDLHASGFEGNILTEYEEKFLADGANIYRLEATVNPKLV